MNSNLQDVGAVFATAQAFRDAGPLPAQITSVRIQSEDGRSNTWKPVTSSKYNDQGAGGFCGLFISDGSASAGIERSFDGSLRLAWYGAYGTFSGTPIDDTARIQAAITESNGEFILEASTKRYGISAELNFTTSSVTKGIKFAGNQCEFHVLSKISGDGVSLSGGSKLRTVLKDFLIKGNKLVERGLYASFVVGFDGDIANIRVDEAKGDGIVFDGCQVSRLSGIVATDCGGNGVVYESCNGAVAIGTRAIRNAGDGIVVRRGSTGYSGGMSLISMDSEVNTGSGLYIEDTTSRVDVTGWSESNGKDGILIGSKTRGAKVNNVEISGIVGDGSNGQYNRAIRIQDGAVGCDVTDNHFHVGDTDFDYAQVEDESTDSRSLNVLSPNYAGTAEKKVNTSRGEYLTQANKGVLTTNEAAGRGGYLAGGVPFIVPALGSITLTFAPVGTSFGIPGSNDRGAYLIETEWVGSLAYALDYTMYRKFHSYAGTGNSKIHDASTTDVISYGDSTRRGKITMSKPVLVGNNEIKIVLSNGNSEGPYTGTMSWSTMMTTKGMLELVIS